MAARTSSALCRSLRLHTSLVQRLDLQRDIFQISRPMLKFHLPNVHRHDRVVFHVRAHKIHIQCRGLSVLIFNIPSFPSSVYLTFETRYSFQHRAFYTPNRAANTSDRRPLDNQKNTSWSKVGVANFFLLFFSDSKVIMRGFFTFVRSLFVEMLPLVLLVPSGGGSESFKHPRESPIDHAGHTVKNSARKAR